MSATAFYFILLKTSTHLQKFRFSSCCRFRKDFDYGSLVRFVGYFRRVLREKKA
jgi:hypothetical protein